MRKHVTGLQKELPQPRRYQEKESPIELQHRMQDSIIHYFLDRVFHRSSENSLRLPNFSNIQNVMSQLKAKHTPNWAFKIKKPICDQAETSSPLLIFQKYTP
jgi:hypothetical protein